VNILNESRQVIDGNAVVADVRRDDVCGQREQSVFGTFIIKHR
jgi:hypothetical protein